MMLETPVPSLVFKMALPTIVSMLVMSVYNMADTYFVSYLGTAATGAVGINLSLMSFIQMAGTALAMGANSFIARLLGQKRFADAESVLSVAFFTSVAIGLVTMVAGLLLSRAFRLERIARPIGWAQTAVTLILIACMGYRLGSRPDVIHELSSMGLMSLLYCIVPSVFSIALVYVVTRFLLKEKKNGRNRDSW